ncbi:DUF397 domain-containing protein [Actinokineospora enzanensis]
MTTTAVGVRDTKNRVAGSLVLVPGSWRALVAAIRESRFDL